jgi:hypothetical protein
MNSVFRVLTTVNLLLPTAVYFEGRFWCVDIQQSDTTFQEGVALPIL